MILSPFFSIEILPAPRRFKTIFRFVVLFCQSAIPGKDPAIGCKAVVLFFITVGRIVDVLKAAVLKADKLLLIVLDGKLVSAVTVSAEMAVRNTSITFDTLFSPLLLTRLKR